MVFTAHYDTCARLPFPNFITPKNIFIFLSYSLLISLPFLALMFVLTTLLAPRLGAAGAFLGMLIGLGAMFYMFFFGAANPHTVNDNTSGVLTLVEAIARMSEEERARCAFIFFDHEENGLLGSGWFASKHKKTMKDKLHPRNFSTYPHALQWAREEGLLPLETVIYKFTGRPAQLMGLRDRGTLAAGNWADITVFDPKTVAETATYVEPMQKPRGIEYVIVNGQIVLRDGAITDARPGRALLAGR